MTILCDLILSVAARIIDHKIVVCMDNSKDAILKDKEHDRKICMTLFYGGRYRCNTKKCKCPCKHCKCTREEHKSSLLCEWGIACEYCGKRKV